MSNNTATGRKVPAWMTGNTVPEFELIRQGDDHAVTIEGETTVIGFTAWRLIELLQAQSTQQGDT